MDKRKKPVFELTEGKTLKRPKTASAEMTRFLVRLLAPVNDTIRQKAMYRGDLSQMVVEALEATDLPGMPLVAMKWGQEEFRGLTLQIPNMTRDKLLAASKRRSVSMNVLINSALVHWLAGQGDVAIAGRKPKAL